MWRHVGKYLIILGLFVPFVEPKSPNRLLFWWRIWIRPEPELQFKLLFLWENMKKSRKFPPVWKRPARWLVRARREPDKKERRERRLQNQRTSSVLITSCCTSCSSITSCCTSCSTSTCTSTCSCSSSAGRCCAPPVRCSSSPSAPPPSSCRRRRPPPAGRGSPPTPPVSPGLRGPGRVSLKEGKRRRNLKRFRLKLD